jgi:hypothetical protein
MKTRIAFSIAITAFATSAANAQSGPLTRTVPVTFTGVVANDVTNEIRIRQPDGSYAPFTGPVPDYAYTKGDVVTLSYNAILPTRAAYQPGGPYQGQVAADGIYRISLVAPAYGGGPLGLGTANNIDVSGPIGPASNFGQPTNLRMTVVYDSNADSYSLELGAPGSFVAGAFAGPGYTYDANTGQLTPCAGASCAPQPADNNQFNLVTTATGLATTGIGIFGTAPGNGAGSGNRAGLFGLSFDGSWNLPIFGGGGSPTSVPEPGTIILFGAATAALMRRRRKRV